ncbi:MAG: MFS transporter [Candidatus Levybacteria bacterium]|nr:MFS transporter [Candidatus Levybacteria bacterium]
MHQNIKLLSWFNFFIDFRFYAPIAILYFAQISGSFALGMSVFSIVTISSALLEIPTGIFSDRIGRHRTLILGSIAGLVSMIFYAAADSFTVLVIGSMFQGLATAFYSGNNDALIHDSLSENNEEGRFGEFYGKIGKMSQIALGISAAVGVVLLLIGSFSLLVWLSIVPQVICVLISFFVKEPRVHSNRSGNIYNHLKEAFLGFKHNPKLRLISLSSIIGYGFGEANYQFQAAIYSMVWPAWAIPIAKIFSNFGAAISFHFSNKNIKRFGKLKMLVIGNIYSRAANSIGAIYPTIFSPIIMSTTSLFLGSTVVAKNSIMQKEFKQEQRATMGSLESFAGSLFFGLVAFLLGFTADKLSPAAAILILQGFQLSSLFIFYRFSKLQKN